MRLWGIILAFFSWSVQAADNIQKLSLPLVPYLDRADLYTLKLFAKPKAILILCPGVNENGRNWLEEPRWLKFAQEEHLDLAALSFASDGTLLRQGRGYYYASTGSGKLLLDGLNSEFPKNIPLLVYGFSGGAQFTSRFAEWDQARILGWCAYSADWWDQPVHHTFPSPGLVICGEDDYRYGASLTYFKEGRSLGDPWLWVTVAHNGHAIAPEAEEFVRHYFSCLLAERRANQTSEWVDIDFKTKAPAALVKEQPSLTAWLPSNSLLSEWQTVHQP